MHKRIVPLVTLLAIGVGAIAYAGVTVRSERADCPGKIVCPLTGEWVCKDRCPLGAARDEKQAALPECCRTADQQLLQPGLATR